MGSVERVRLQLLSRPCDEAAVNHHNRRKWSGTRRLAEEPLPAMAVPCDRSNRFKWGSLLRNRGPCDGFARGLTGGKKRCQDRCRDARGKYRDYRQPGVVVWHVEILLLN
jgi:hypothetical protein